MSLGAHLLELRKRLFIAAIGIVAGAIAGWFLSDFVLDAIRGPITQISEQQGRVASINWDNIGGAFDLKIQIALTIGIVASAPVWLYQIWAFLVPGLTRKEKAYSVGFLGASIPLFFAGCVAGWYVLPHIVVLLASFAPTEDTNLITARGYYDFVLKLVLAVGIAFVLPVFLVLLNFVGVLSASTIIKSWRFAILAIVLFTAIATPAADPTAMILLAIPMVVLYFAAYGVAWIHDWRVARNGDRLEAELAA